MILDDVDGDDGPHGAGRRGGLDDETVEAGADKAFIPDHEIRDGHVFNGPDWTLEAVYTPGHTSNHMCFALAEENCLFSGDHVMGWSTTVISPPDGDMKAYLESLQKAGWFMIMSQLPPPQPGWAQQYNQYLQPAWARSFEPPAVCSLVTIRNIHTLIELYTYTNDDFRSTAQAIFDGRFGDFSWIEERPLEDGAQAFKDLDARSVRAAKIVLKP